MICFRILHKKYGDPLFAPGLAGRWNSEGKKILYCAGSIPLAFMESMIRRKGIGFNDNFHTAVIEIPETIEVAAITVRDLKAGWSDPFNYEICQSLGDQWYDDHESLVLAVPSAVMRTDQNFLINTTHKDFKKVKLKRLLPLVPDPRIEDILRGSK